MPRDTSPVPQPETFGAVLLDILHTRSEYKTELLDNVNLRLFHQAVVRRAGVDATRDWSYETIRKVIVGERNASMQLMETISSILGLDPMLFADYRVLRAKRDFEFDKVGRAQAVENADRYLGYRKNGQAPSPRPADL